MYDDYLEYKLSQVMLLKCLYDLGRLKALWVDMNKHYATEVFHEDFDMDLAMYVQCALFDSCDGNFNEDYETEILTISDGIIDRYFRLCLEYEQKKGIFPMQDPFYRDADQYLCDALGNLSVHNHAYVVYYLTEDAGSCQIMYEYGQEEWFGSETLVAFADYLLYLRDGTVKIKAAIEALDRLTVVPFPGLAAPRKEAA